MLWERDDDLVLRPLGFGEISAVGFAFMYKALLRSLIAGALLIGVLPLAQAGPYCGWGGGWGGYRGGCGSGWYGTGIPNGLGWTMFGLAAAGGVAAGAACAAPVVYGTPYVFPAPVYTVPAPIYAAPAYGSVGYYQPPQTVVVEKKVSRPKADPPSNTLAKAEAKLAGLGYYKGSVDGEYGPVIQQAIQQFQADNGLPVSGRLDLKTLSSLGIAL
jgi:hypothetical protein